MTTVFVDEASYEERTVIRERILTNDSLELSNTEYSRSTLYTGSSKKSTFPAPAGPGHFMKLLSRAAI
jgi:hypothetical protein